MIVKSESEDTYECKQCHELYELGDGLEPTDYCNTCAQELVSTLRTQLKSVEVERERIPTMDQPQQQALLGYIEEQARVADQNSKDWEASGDKVNAAYRAGMWYAYNDIRNRIPPTNERINE